MRRAVAGWPCRVAGRGGMAVPRQRLAPSPRAIASRSLVLSPSALLCQIDMGGRLVPSPRALVLSPPALLCQIDMGGRQGGHLIAWLDSVGFQGRSATFSSGQSSRNGGRFAADLAAFHGHADPGCRNGRNVAAHVQINNARVRLAERRSVRCQWPRTGPMRIQNGDLAEPATSARLSAGRRRAFDPVGMRGFDRVQLTVNASRGAVRPR